MFLFYINEIFFALRKIDICYFADETTPYICDSNTKTVLKKLGHSPELAITWFETHNMKLNTDKCHLFTSGSKHEHMWAKIGQEIVWESNTVKLLRVSIENHLKFDNQVTKTFKSQ